jgi:signal peptidase II
VRARWWLLAGVAATVFVVDQLTKWWAREALEERVIHVVWTLQLRLTHNFGTAFSIGQGRGALISLLALGAVAVLLLTGRRATRKTVAVALGLVVGGAVGNLTDRAIRDGDGFLGGGVVDFIDLQWWPVFNLADTAIVLGAGLLIFSGWHEHMRTERGLRQRRDQRDQEVENSPGRGEIAIEGSHGSRSRVLDEP